MKFVQAGSLSASPCVLACMVFCTLAACGGGTPKCEAPSPVDHEVMTAFAVYLDAPPETATVHLKSDLQETFTKLWGQVDLQDGALPAETPGIWLSTSDTARALVGNVSERGYAMKRIDDRIVVWAKDAVALQWASFALCEELGARFFHPMQDLLPSYGEVRIPRTLDVSREPAFDQRGLHLHLLHPTEYLLAFNGTNPDDHQVAFRLLDWLVKTGQNHVQWPIMSTMPFDEWSAYIRPVIDYAHERGITVGVNPILFGKSSLQNNFILAEDQDQWQSQLEANLDRLLALPFDHLELSLGEFLAEDFEYVLQLLNHTVSYTAQQRPGFEVSVVNHVGEFENLYQEFRGERTYFYFLPGQAVPELTNTIHTVFFYDLYRDRAMYGHDNFRGHRDFLLGELGERKLRYLPETAYWVTADVDVPIFLPEYIRSRWTDVHNLYRDTAERGHRLDGHVIFTTGHEWNYWMNDYLTARAYWQPEAEVSEGIEHYASSFDGCAAQVETHLTAMMDLQTEFLFDQHLVGHLSGEDLHDDLGHALGFSTHPVPRPFESFVGTPPGERAAFETEVVEQLELYADMTAPHATSVEAMAKTADPTTAPWLRELADGMRINELRARHAAALYRAVLSRLANDPQTAGEMLTAAETIRDTARGVLDRRASDYRFSLEQLTGAYQNPTIYEFGYLRQAHTLCYWTRPAIQATSIVETLQPVLATELPKCLD